MRMSNSSLVTYKHIVKNKDKGRGGNSIQKIFVHHMAGQLTVKQCGSVFDKRPASAHYGVQGNNIGLYVNESDTAWHCGNYKWNQRSIGIELSNDGGAKTGWHVADSTIETAIRLIADICKRNGIKKLNYTGDMKGNLCQHRWVASTACPGSYLAKQFKRIETGVNALLSVSDEEFNKVHAFTIKAQNFMGTSADGYVSGQDPDLAEYFDYLVPVVESWDSSGSDFVRALQKWLGVDKDGTLGPVTVKALQKKVGADVDGYWGPLTAAAFEVYIDKYGTVSNAIAATNAVVNTPSNDPMQPWFDAMTTQFNWSKNQKYKFNTSPTVANSKKEGTCITFPAVSLQRLGLLPKGKYFYFYPKTKKIAGNGADYAKKHTEIYKISYPNKTVKALWKEGKIKVGDIVGYGNPGYHTMVFMGFNSKGKPIFNTMGHTKKLKGTMKSYASRKVNMLVHLKKASK